MYHGRRVVKNAVTWGNLQPKLEKTKKKPTLKKKFLIFFLKNPTLKNFLHFPKKKSILDGPT